MRHLLKIISLLLFSLTIISCSSSDDGGSSSSDNTSSTTTSDDDSTTNDDSTTDTTAPSIGISGGGIPTITNDNTPDFSFSSSEAGTITYYGSCSSSTTSATTDTNTVTFNTLSDGTYTDCTITVTDSAGNVSNPLLITFFTVDATAPTISSISPTDNQTGVSISDNISVTFSEAMYTITINTDNTTCYGSLQLSSDNFSSCVQMSSSTNSNSDKTFTIDPSDNLSYSTTYKMRVTTEFKDYAGNTLGSQYETSNGFMTKTWSGTQQLGTSSDDFGYGVALDNSSNIYVTGYTDGGIDGNTNVGNEDIFLVKYNSSGTKQWTRQFGTTSKEIGEDVVVDSSHNIYITGQTNGDLDNKSNSGWSDIFLVKYDSSGTKQWTQLLGTTSNDFAYGVTVDNSSNIYLTGYTTSVFDNTSGIGGRDTFLVKYDSNGTKLWIHQFGSTLNDYGRGVTVDSSNNIYVTGYTKGGLDNNTSSGSDDIFLAKFNSSGTKQWTQQIGTSSADYGRGVSVDSSDNIYVTGDTSGGLDGNSNAGGNNPLSDIFLVKYNSSGTKLWTRQIGSSSYDSAWGIAVDNSSNIYVTGYTYGVFDGKATSGSDDIFIIKYNSSGTKQWSRLLSNASQNLAYSVTVDSFNNIFVTGSTSGDLDGNSNVGGKDVFLVKYNSDGVLQ